MKNLPEHIYLNFGELDEEELRDTDYKNIQNGKLLGVKILYLPEIRNI